MEVEVKNDMAPEERDEHEKEEEEKVEDKGEAQPCVISFA